LKAGESAPVAIRQHDIQLSTQGRADQQNALKARVTRQVFLGGTRDYLVEVADGTTLRVVTSPDNIVAEGAEVWLTLPPDRCRALSR
jgi:iron(III) transport system ATP-binding protein